MSSSVFNANLLDSFLNINTYSQQVNFNDTVRFDFRLSNSSPGIGYGTYKYNLPFNYKDFYGANRPNPAGSNPDVGAIENPYAFPAPQLQSVEGSDKKVKLFWENYSIPGVVRFKIFRTTSPIPDDASNGLLTDTISVKSNSYTDVSGLTNLTRFYYRMKVVDSLGNESGFSNELSVRPNVPPPVVVNIEAEGGPSSILLKWKPSSIVGVTYSVYRSVDSVKENAKLIKSLVTEEKYLDDSLSKSVPKYYYWIKAVDSVGATSEFSKFIASQVTSTWYVSTSGTDTNGGSINFPLRNISTAIRKLTDGDTIIVRKGIYSDSLNFGTKLFVLKSESGADSTRIKLLFIPNHPFLLMISRPGHKDSSMNNQIYGFTFTLDNYSPNGTVPAVSFASYAAPHFFNCRFEKFFIIFTRIENAHFQNCIFRFNETIASVNEWGSNASFINCTFDRNKEFTRFTSLNSSRLLILNCILTYFGQDTTYVKDANNVSQLPSGLQIINSIVDDTVNSKINGNSGIRPSFLASDGNYRLTNLSNGIGLGLGRYTYNNREYKAPERDFYGNLRPNPVGSRPDVGAIENENASPIPQLGQIQRINDTALIKWDYFDKNRVRRIVLYRDTSANLDTLRAIKKIVSINAADPYFKDTFSFNTKQQYFYAIKILLNDSSISGLSNVKSANDLVKRPSFLPPMINAKYAWGDIDSDGDMDLAVMGNANEIFLQIYKNNDTAFIELLDRTKVPQVYRGTIKFADIDNDGDIDLFVSGQKTTNTSNLGAYLFKNDGKAIFTNVELASVISTRDGDAAFGDHDNDGDLDLALSGIDATGKSILKLYNNSGLGIFTQETRFFSATTGPSNISYADIAWVDYDNDGDQDLIYTGVTSMIYGGVVRNTLISDSSTTASGNQVLFSDFSMKDSNFDLADLNSDGNVDMVISGTGGTKIIYNQNIKTSSMNLGSISTLIDSVAGKVKLADYDNDGDIDILLAGTDNLANPKTIFYVNSGDGRNFVKKSYEIIPNLDLAGFSWADYDNDRDLDLVISGQKPSSQGGNVISEIYSFEPEKDNYAPDPPKNVKLINYGDGRVLLNWDHATDDLNPPGTLNYLVKIGSFGLNGNISAPITVVESNIKGGNLLNPEAVLVYSNRYFTQLDPGKYYILVQSVDYNKLTSKFSDTLFFTLTYPWKIVNQGGIVDGTIGGNTNFSAKWSDIDRDNDYDFIYGGNLYESNKVNYKPAIYPNNASGLLNSMINPLIKWTDLSQDGIPDLIVSSSELITPLNANNEKFRLNVFLNDTSVTSIDPITKQVTGKGRLTRVSIPSSDSIFLGNTKFKISDINNDGKPDILFAGLNKNTESRVHVFSTGTLPSDTSTSIKFRFTPLNTNLDSLLLSQESADLLFDFGDIDKDNDNDFVTIYKTGTGKNLARVYLNNGFDSLSGKIMFKENTRYVFEPMENATLDLVDFDKDGDLDLITTGRSFLSGKQFAFYETRDSSFVRISTNIIPFDNGKMAFGDLNNDGFIDLIYSGIREGVGFISKIALFSPINKTFTEQAQFFLGNFDNLNIEFGDFDGDNDLDVLLFGKEKPSGKQVFRVYKNVQNESALVQKAFKNNGKANSIKTNDISLMANLNNPTRDKFVNINNNSNSTLVDEYIENQPPSVPNNLKENVVRKIQNKFRVKFNWEMSTDDRTPANGLTYELRVGTKSGLSDVVVSSSKENGFKLIPEEGNVGRNISWEIDLLPGKYYWTVQSIDASLSGSQFAIEKQFTVNAIGGICSAEIPVITVINNKISICKGDSTRLISNVKGQLQWYKDDVLMQGVTDTAIKVTTPGIYKVINAVSGCSPVSSTPFVITQKVISTPQLTRTSAELVSSSINGNQWYLDGSIIPGANTQKFTPVKSGLYTVKVFLDNCESELSESYYYILTSVLNFDNGQYIKIYPNPIQSDGVVNIERKINNYNGPLNVAILDVTGKVIKTLTLKSNERQVKLPGISGNYILRIYWDDSHQYLFKIFKN